MIFICYTNNSHQIQFLCKHTQIVISFQPINFFHLFTTREIRKKNDRTRNVLKIE